MFTDQVPLGVVQLDAGLLTPAFAKAGHAQNGRGGFGHKLKLRPHKEAQNKTNNTGHVQHGSGEAWGQSEILQSL